MAINLATYSPSMMMAVADPSNPSNASVVATLDTSSSNLAMVPMAAPYGKEVAASVGPTTAEHVPDATLLFWLPALSALLF